MSDITLTMPSALLTSRWGRRSSLHDPSSLRVEVCPPSLRLAPASLWQRLLFWLMAPAPQQAAPPLSRLPAVRREFVAVLADIGSDEARKLRWRINEARSLRELWHLRADTYRVVGLALNQSEAESRVARLNPHFPTRAPRNTMLPS